MKIRIKGNSLRLRLTQTEIQQFGSTGEVSETISFGGIPRKELTYSLVKSSEREQIHASYKDDQIKVFIPASMATDWVNTELVGMEEMVNTGYGEELKLLVEKDFQCLKPRVGEDDSDAFPNPLAEHL